MRIFVTAAHVLATVLMAVGFMCDDLVSVSGAAYLEALAVFVKIDMK